MASAEMIVKIEMTDEVRAAIDEAKRQCGIDGRCGTCKWWDASTHDRGVCLRIIVDNDFSLIDNDERLAVVDAGAYDDYAGKCDSPIDGDGNVLAVSAVLWTRLDFGCVQHEPREPS